MTTDTTNDSLSVLGLDSTAELTTATLKRAYFSRLREYPPHADPDGFRRLRQAYERLLQPGVIAALAESRGTSREAILEDLSRRLDPRLARARAHLAQHVDDATKRETFERVILASPWSSLLEALDANASAATRAVDSTT